jgi:cullin 1
MSQPQPAPAALEFPEPPSRKDAEADPAATLAWLKENITTIYLTGRRTSPSQDKPPALAPSAYLGLYTAVHNYCRFAIHMRSTKSNAAQLTGEYLYRGLEEIIRDHCSQVRASLLFLSKEPTAAAEMIQEYLAQWGMLKKHLAALVSHTLGHMERHWVRRELDEKRKGIHLIQDLHTVVWKEEILPQVSEDSTTATAVTTRSELRRALETLLQEQGGDGAESDRKDLAERFLESLRSIGVDLEASV